MPPSSGKGCGKLASGGCTLTLPSTKTGPETINPLTGHVGYARNGFATRTRRPAFEATSQKVRPRMRSLFSVVLPLRISR